MKEINSYVSGSQRAIDKIHELVKTNSVVNRAMMLYFNGDVSYKEALEIMVIALVEIQEKTSNKLLKYVNRFG